MKHRDKLEAVINILKKREITLIVLIIMLTVLITLRAPKFLEPSNLRRIVNDTSILIMVSLAQFFIILSGGIDLSVGSVIAFSGMSASMMNQYYPALPIGLVILAGTGIGLLLGIFNGAVVAFGKVPPIITTLGTMSIFRGMTFVLSKGQWVTAHEMTQTYMRIPHGNFLGLTNLIWSALLISLAMYYFSTYCKTGREIYAIGGNSIAAELVGVSKKKINMIIFSISGAISGFAGVMWTARYAAAVNETATEFELQTVAACVIGGVSIAGGAGGVAGVILGALFLGIINNALPVVHLSPFLQMFIQGLIVLLAMLANTLMEQRQRQVLLNRRCV
jgi:rhamnose transport system permease protein